MAIKSVLIEYSEEDYLFSITAMLFQNRWIVFPAAGLIISLSKKKTIPDDLLNLQSSKLYHTNYLDLKPDNIKVIMNSELSKDYKYFLGKYVGIFSCNNIKETIQDFPLGCGDSSNSNLDFNSYLSLFIILDLNMNENFTEKVFFDSVTNLVKASSNFTINRGNLVCIESAPFGCRELLGSFSQGIICNCVGKNNCFILTDTPTAPGSEGAPIYLFRNDNSKSDKIPIGIVISSLNWWRGEHTGLTLGVLLVPLLSQLLPKKWNVQQYLFSKKNSIMYSADKSIVQVFCGNGWGTGVLIDKALGIFITGSHVVKNAKTDSIILKWRNNEFPCSLVYRTENSAVFDIAVLKCLPQHINKMHALKFAIKPAIKGENVLAAGYPIFNSNDFIFPVVTKGNISIADNCILYTTCCILAGSSGGAILRPNGELIGIIVCHTTATVNNDFVVYPKINMAIPISAIAKPLLLYIKTKDVTHLKQLETEDSYILKKWHLFKAKL